MNRTKKIILNALFLASAIVLGRFLSIRTPIVTIGFTFVPIMLAAIIIDWKSAVFVATLADLIGALLFPTGSYFWGFTFTAFLNGLTYGLLLTNKNEFKIDKKFILKLILSVVIVSLVWELFLNTYWLKMFSQKAYMALIIPRVIKQLIMIPIKVLTILAITRIFKERINNFKNND